jgi:hypothetical protein
LGEGGGGKRFEVKKIEKIKYTMNKYTHAIAAAIFFPLFQKMRRTFSSPFNAMFPLPQTLLI